MNHFPRKIKYFFTQPVFHFQEIFYGFYGFFWFHQNSPRDFVLPPYPLTAPTIFLSVFRIILYITSIPFQKLENIAQWRPSIFP